MQEFLGSVHLRITQAIYAAPKHKLDFCWHKFKLATTESRSQAATTKEKKKEKKKKKHLPPKTNP